MAKELDVRELLKTQTRQEVKELLMRLQVVGGMSEAETYILFELGISKGDRVHLDHYPSKSSGESAT